MDIYLSKQLSFPFLVPHYEHGLTTLVTSLVVRWLAFLYKESSSSSTMTVAGNRTLWGDSSRPARPLMRRSGSFGFLFHSGRVGCVQGLGDPLSSLGHGSGGPGIQRDNYLLPGQLVILGDSSLGVGGKSCTMGSLPIFSSWPVSYVFRCRVPTLMSLLSVLESVAHAPCFP